MQSHTYAGSSTRALLAATEVLQTFVTWLPSVAHLGDEMGHIMAYVMKISRGLFRCQGQGLMWGGIVTHEGQCRDPEFRTRVVQAFKKHCDEVGVVPYHVPVGGFMVSPVIDVDVGTIYEIGERLVEAIKLTMTEVGWVEQPAVNGESSVGGINIQRSRDHYRAPSIASASTLNLAALAEAKASLMAMTQDLGNDKCVPYLHATKCCTSCNSFVCPDVRTRFLNQ
jgi:hypothetical protein